MPGIVQRAVMLPASSMIGPDTSDIRKQIIQTSVIQGRYEKVIDHEAAHEKLQSRTLNSTMRSKAGRAPQNENQPVARSLDSHINSEPSPTVLDSVIKAANSPIGRQIDQILMRSLMGLFIGLPSRRSQDYLLSKPHKRTAEIQRDNLN